MNPWYMFTLILDTLPLCSVQHYFLKNRGRFSYRKTLLITDSIIFFFAAFFAYLASLPFSNLTIMLVFRFSILFIMYFVRSWLVPGYPWQNLYLCLIIVPYVVLGIGISAIFVPAVSDLIPNAPDYMIITLLRCIFYLIIIYPTYRLWKKFLFPSFEFPNKGMWLSVCGIQFLTNCGVLLCTQTDYYSNGISGRNLAIFLVMALLSIMVSLELFSVGERFKTHFQLENERKNGEHLLQLQASQYPAITDSIKEMQRIRHDVKHHLRTIKTLLSEGKTEDSITYIDDYVASIPSSNLKLYCDDSAVNALLNYYGHLANEAGIDYDVKVSAVLYDVLKSITSIDLCILLGNAIENAYEASKDSEGNYIKVNINEAIGNLYITVDNSFSSDFAPREYGESFLSHKRKYRSTGIGIYSMRSVVKKYSGEFSTSVNGNVFSLNAVLSI